MSQGYNETYDPSEGEEEERKKKEEEERQKELDARVEAKKKALAAKKSSKAKKSALVVDAPQKIVEEVKNDSGSDNIGKASGHDTAEEGINGSNGSSDNLNKNDAA